MKTYSQNEIANVRDRNEAWLMQQDGVIGTGIGLDSNGHVCLRIFTHDTKPETKRTIQSALGSVPVRWEEGEVVAD